jgi:hypothetical protein
VGFDRPILHGLASMGISVRQVLAVFGGDDPASVKSVKVCWHKRFQTSGRGERLSKQFGSRVHVQQTAGVYHQWVQRLA